MNKSRLMKTILSI